MNNLINYSLMILDELAITCWDIRFAIDFLIKYFNSQEKFSLMEKSNDIGGCSVKCYPDHSIEKVFSTTLVSHFKSTDIYLMASLYSPCLPSHHLRMALVSSVITQSDHLLKLNISLGTCPIYCGWFSKVSLPYFLLY